MSLPARPSREEIYQALFDAVSKLTVPDADGNLVPAFVTTSRRWLHWTKVAVEQQPALFQVQRREQRSTEQRPGLPPKWNLKVDLFIYVNGGADPAIASSVLNPILDGLEKLLPYQGGPYGANPIVQNNRYQSLGFPPGSVQLVQIEDAAIEINEGLLSPESQTVAIVPIEVIRV